jgi:hypothetical protein
LNLLDLKELGKYKDKGGNSMEDFRILDRQAEKQTLQLRLRDIPEYHSLIEGSQGLVRPPIVIEFFLHRNSDVELKIQDPRGEDIAILLSAQLDKGKFRISWDTDNLPSGEYLFILKAGKFLKKKKFRLVK